MAAVNPDGTPDWRVWKQVPFGTLVEVVALSLDIDPRLVEYSRGEWISMGAAFAKRPEFSERLFIAVRTLESKSGLSPRDKYLTRSDTTTCEVMLGDFAEWAASKGWDLPISMVELIPVAHDPKVLNPSSTPAWPWGTHETELLRQLARAAREFWSTYDPDQPATAPKSEEVGAWLVKQGVSKRVAEVMAQILRPSTLPTGPRTS